MHATLEKPIQIGELEQLLRRLQSVETTPKIDRLLQAIRDDELRLDFQPVVTMRPRALKKLEALVRWNHPTRGRISPNEFLPGAEANTTLIDALTEWVMGAAVKSYLILSEYGITFTIAINISTRNLHDLALPDRFQHMLS